MHIVFQSSQERLQIAALIAMAIFSIGVVPAQIRAADAPPIVTAVENLGIIPSSQPLHGLGFNIDPQNEWEYKLAQQAGAIEDRFGCDWRSVELQTAQNISAGYTLPASCASGLSFSAKYGLQPLVIASYGPPFQPIVRLQVTAAVPSGSYVIPVVAISGSLSSINVPYCHVIEASGTQITVNGTNSYAGALITAVDAAHGTITIAAATATNITLAAGTLLTVNQLLYPSVATTSTTDASIQAYAGHVGQADGAYVGFLANSIYNAGLTGRVEIWNEPPWAHDPWDTRDRFYDSNIPANLSQPAVEFGFAAVLETQTPPGNVRYNWAGPQKSGFNSLLGNRMSPIPTQLQVQSSFTSESFHPYTNNPEDGAWDPVCLAKLSGWNQCILSGTDPTNNLRAAIQYNLANKAKYGWGIEQNITETGLATSNQTAKARFIMRQFLMLQGLGIPRITLFKLADAGANYGLVDLNTQVPQPAYNAISGLMQDLNTLAGPPVAAYIQSALPSVIGFTGYFPLTVIQIVGSTASTDTTNSVLFTCWQRSAYPATTPWAAQPSPGAVPMTVQLPSGMMALSAVNIDSRIPVPFTVSGSQITFSVADDPIELKVVPATYQTTTTLTANPTSTTQGSSVTFTATVTAGAGTPGGLVTFLDGGTSIGTASLATSGIATYATTSLSLGIHTITASYAANGVYPASVSNPIVETVLSPLATTTLLTASPAMPSFGQSVELTATVTGSTPTGSVTFYDGSTALGTGTLDTSGIATLSLSTLAIGPHSITAQYGGDTTHNASNSSVMTVTVTPQPVATIITLSASALNVIQGSSVIFTAAVTATANGISTGSVTFYDGSTALGAGTLNASGIATLSLSTLTTGSHGITAQYSGDTIHNASSSSEVTVTVTPQPVATATTLSASTLSPNQGSSVIFTATVTAMANGIPTGSVTFYDGSTALGAGMLNASGIATLSLSTLALGSHSITAQYGGDTTHNASTSNTLIESVVPPSFFISLNPTSITFSSVQSENVVVTMTPSGGFNQPVNFSCGILPSHASCRFSFSTLTPDGSNAPLSTMLYVAVGGQTALMHKNWVHPSRHNSIYELSLLVLAGLGGAARRLRKRLFTSGGMMTGICLALPLALVAGALSGCGSGGDIAPSETTPSGNYRMTITATSSVVTSNASLNVNVM